MPDERGELDPLSEKENMEALAVGHAMRGDYPTQEPMVELRHRVSVRKQLSYQLTELKKRTEEIEGLLKRLDANPDIEYVLNAMRRLGI